jgi:hypothetical protein
MSVTSMEMRSEVLGEKSAETLSSMGMVGLTWSLGGKYEEAEAMHRQTLATREKVLGRKHPDTLTSVYCLAHLLAEQGCRPVRQSMRWVRRGPWRRPLLRPQQKDLSSAYQMCASSTTQDSSIKGLRSRD